jgi:hypothetical protein
MSCGRHPFFHYIMNESLLHHTKSMQVLLLRAQPMGTEDAESRQSPYSASVIMSALNFLSHRTVNG